MKKINWLKAYRKAENPYDVIREFSSEMLQNYMHAFHTQSRKLFFAEVNSIDSKARQIASIHRELKDGYKLSSNWWRCLLIQVSSCNNLDKSELYGYGTYEDAARAFCALLKWDYDDSVSPQYDSMRTTHIMFFGDTDGICHPYKIILEPCHPMPIGSIWESSKGKLWECNGLENGLYVMIEEEPTLKSGKYRHLYLSEKQLMSMRRVK